MAASPSGGDPFKSSGCPVAHGQGGADPAADPNAAPTEAAGGDKANACPVDHASMPGFKKASWPPKADEVGPFVTDAPRTNPDLSNIAVASDIPRGDGHHEETWTFPSPQRFYNALKRKGWEAREEDMTAIVSIHNTMNSRTWMMVKAYESFHAEECSSPRLKRFYRVFGTDKDWSPKSQLMHLVGYKRPFDRHDWLVDRCGREVRYVIDYYPGKPIAGTDIPSVYIDVRPALDSFEGALDRVRMQLAEYIPALRPPVESPPPTKP